MSCHGADVLVDAGWGSGTSPAGGRWLHDAAHAFPRSPQQPHGTECMLEDPTGCSGTCPGA